MREYPGQGYPPLRPGQECFSSRNTYKSAKALVTVDQIINETLEKAGRDGIVVSAAPTANYIALAAGRGSTKCAANSLCYIEYKGVTFYFNPTINRFFSPNQGQEMMDEIYRYGRRKPFSKVWLLNIGSNNYIVEVPILYSSTPR